MLFGAYSLAMQPLQSPVQVMWRPAAWADHKTAGRAGATSLGADSHCTDIMLLQLAGILSAILHDIPASWERILAPALNGAMTLWNAIEAGNPSTCISITGIGPHAHLRHGCSGASLLMWQENSSWRDKG